MLAARVRDLVVEDPRDRTQEQLIGRVHAATHTRAAQLELSPHFGFNVDLQVLFGVEDCAKDDDLTLATMGMVYSFHDE